MWVPNRNNNAEQRHVEWHMVTQHTWTVTHKASKKAFSFLEPKVQHTEKIVMYQVILNLIRLFQVLPLLVQLTTEYLVWISRPVDATLR